jgi:hypothetical protein
VFFCKPMENLSGFDIPDDGDSMSCHFLSPRKRKQKNLFTLAPAFPKPLLEDRPDDENRHERHNDPSEKHRQNDQRPEDKPKPALPDSGEARLNCSPQPFLGDRSDCRRYPAPDACERQDHCPARGREDTPYARPSEPCEKDDVLN